MILSLDLSTKSSGWAVFDGTNLIDHGCLKASSTDVIKRIQKMIKELNKNILSKYPIKTIVVEEVRPNAAAGSVRTHKVLMWLQAALEFIVHEQHSETKIEYVYPSEWRKACGIKNGRGIKRDAAKQLDIDFVKETYDITVGDDEADAIGIGHAFVHKLSNEVNWG